MTEIDGLLLNTVNMASPPNTKNHQHGRRRTLATLNVASIPEELAMPKVVSRRRSQPNRTKPTSVLPTAEHLYDTAAATVHDVAARSVIKGQQDKDSPDSVIADKDFLDSHNQTVLLEHQDSKESLASLSEDEEIDEGDNSDSDSGFSGSNESSSNTLDWNAALDRW